MSIVRAQYVVEKMAWDAPLVMEFRPRPSYVYTHLMGRDLHHSNKVFRMTLNGVNTCYLAVVTCVAGMTQLRNYEVTLEDKVFTTELLLLVDMNSVQVDMYRKKL